MKTLTLGLVIGLFSIPSAFGQSANAPGDVETACTKVQGTFNQRALQCFCGGTDSDHQLDPFAQICRNQKAVYTSAKVEVKLDSTPPVSPTENPEIIKKLHELAFGTCNYSQHTTIAGLTKNSITGQHWPILVKYNDSGEGSGKTYCYGQVTCSHTNNSSLATFSASCPLTGASCDAAGTCLEENWLNDQNSTGPEHVIDFHVVHSQTIPDTTTNTTGSGVTNH